MASKAQVREWRANVEAWQYGQASSMPVVQMAIMLERAAELLAACDGLMDVLVTEGVLTRTEEGCGLVKRWLAEWRGEAPAGGER
jgi:hypothetical protein